MSQRIYEIVYNHFGIPGCPGCEVKKHNIIVLRHCFPVGFSNTAGRDSISSSKKSQPSCLAFADIFIFRVGDSFWASSTFKNEFFIGTNNRFYFGRIISENQVFFVRRCGRHRNCADFMKGYDCKPELVVSF